MPRIIEKELSYKLVGILFDVHTRLGNRYQEKYYQRAVAEALKENNLKFEKELEVDLKYKDAKIGKYFSDFLIEKKVILEIKAVPCLLPRDFHQVLAYLKARKLELGILANFRSASLAYERILNSDLKTRIDTNS
ncbi:MAG: GxxExxY protein [Candidatus Curtissbacteria bacterium]|nr:GxxExxY protein [Candidatus Curtissbacteria bacterium]